MKRPPIARTLRRACRFRCPACGDGRLFNGVFRVRPECAECGLVFYREAGYFVGAMYLNFILSAIVWLLFYGVAYFLPPLLHISYGARNALWFGFGVLLCLALMRFSYSLWLAVDFWIQPWRPGEAPQS